jgi:glucokinase
MALQIGIDLGGTSAKIGVVDDAYQIVARAEVPTGAELPFQVLVRAFADAIGAFPPALTGEVRSIGIGVPSSIVCDTRIVVHANNLGWRNVDVVSELQTYFPCPIGIANDADSAAYGEALAGAGVGYDYLLMLTLGTGVGGGIIDHGRIFLGGNGCGIEPGHMTIVENGLRCTCGRYGCLESYASATALNREIAAAAQESRSATLRDMLALAGGQPNARMAFEAAALGDVAARRILTAYLHSLAVGISNMVTLFRPQVIVLGGGISNAGKMLFAPLRQLVCDMTYGVDIMGCPSVVPAKLGNDAGIVGAAFLHRQSLPPDTSA